MNEALTWATYSTAIVPAFLFRRFGHMKSRFVVPLAALLAAAAWSGVALYTGSDSEDPWFGIGIILAFNFGTAFSFVGIGAAMWLE